MKHLVLDLGSEAVVVGISLSLGFDLTNWFLIFIFKKVIDMSYKIKMV